MDRTAQADKGYAELIAVYLSVMDSLEAVALLRRSSSNPAHLTTA